MSIATKTVEIPDEILNTHMDIKTFSEVMGMRVSSAYNFFENHPYLLIFEHPHVTTPGMILAYISEAERNPNPRNQNVINRKNEIRKNILKLKPNKKIDPTYTFIQIKSKFKILNDDDTRKIANGFGLRDHYMDYSVHRSTVMEYIEKILPERLCLDPELKESAPFLLSMGMKNFLREIVFEDGVRSQEKALINRLYDVALSVDEKFGDSGKEKLSKGFENIRRFSGCKQYKQYCEAVITIFEMGIYGILNKIASLDGKNAYDNLIEDCL